MHAHSNLVSRIVPYFVLVVVLLGLSAGTSSAQTFSPPFQLSTTGMGSQIAVDSSGNIYVVWRDWSISWPNSNLMFARSTDGGVTFSKPAPISIIPGAESVLAPQIAVDGSGRIYVLAIGSVSAGNGKYFDAIFEVHSTDGGATFSATSITNPEETYILWNPIMTLGPDASVNVLWMPLNASVAAAPPYPSALSVSRSTDGGATFSRTAVWPWPPDPNAGINANDQLAVDSDGNIYVVWNYCAESQPPCKVFFSRSTDQGKTYSAAMTVGNGGNSQLLIDSAGNLDLAWEGGGKLFRRSTDQGTTFSAPTTIPDGRLALDSKGDIFDLWSQSGSLILSRSTDGGSTFSQVNNLGHLSANSLAIDSHDDIDIPVMTGSGASSQIALVRSTDGGNTFSSPAQISQDTQHLCPSLSQMALEKNGNIDAVWEEFNSPYGTTGVAGCDSGPNQVLFSRGIVPHPDFTISAAPASDSLLPGGVAKFTVTLSASGGFSDAVNLACSGLPSGTDCAFDSSSVTPTSGGAKANVTVTTPPTLAAGNYTVTIAASSNGTKHTADVQVDVGGLSGSVSPASATVNVGSSANFNVSLTASGGFAGPVNFACSGLASGLGCSFNPAQVTLAANGSANSTLTVNVASKPSASLDAFPAAKPQAPLSGNLPLLAISVALAAALFAMRRIRTCPTAGLVALSLALVLAVGLIACGGVTTKSTSTSGSGTTGATGTTGASGGTGGTGGSGGSGGTGGSGGAGGTGGTGGSGGGGTGGGSSVTTQFTVQVQSGGGTANLGTVSITVP